MASDLGSAIATRASEARAHKDAVRALTSSLKAADKRVGELEGLLSRISQLKPTDQKVPAWLKPKRDGRVKHLATPVLMLSDLHLDEVVDKGEMDGLNEYNREVATARLERVINKTVDYLRTYTAGVAINGIIVALLGDIITGVIHEELAKTNEAPVPATIVHWVPKLASALIHLADEFGHVFVPTCDGNHDRTGKKIPFKNRVEESFAFLIYNWLADTLRDDTRITFSISQSPEQIISVYNTSFLLSHGDGAKGGGGIAGPYLPIARWVNKKQAMYGSQRRPFDYALMGHWHTLLFGQNMVVNGSTKGFDEFARGLAFPFERPQQALFLVTPENGVTTRTSIYAD